MVLPFLLPLCAQPPAPQGQPKRPMPEPKNLKVLKIPTPELIPVMRSYTVALGVKCDFCHVQGDFSSDEKPTKGIARKMIVMTDDINTKFEDNKVHVACYTCHRGQTEPKTAPPPAPAPAQ